jgi:hypothetical protein
LGLRGWGVLIIIYFNMEQDQLQRKQNLEYKESLMTTHQSILEQQVEAKNHPGQK